LMTGGGYRVWGPPGSFIAGNNELAAALLMVTPFFFFLAKSVTRRWLQYALYGGATLIMISVMFSYSRGAFLAMAVTALYLWWHSRRKGALAALALVGILGALPFVPEQWFARMDTIQTYQEDESAMQRINSWTHAFNIAKDRITGAGYSAWTKQLYAIYAPDPTQVFDAHSIYFQMMGEHGFIGLGLFLLLFFLGWSKAGALRRKHQHNPEMRWAVRLMAMSQVSLVAYASGGAFLGLGFFDLPYHILTFVVITERLIEQQSTATQPRPV